MSGSRTKANRRAEMPPELRGARIARPVSLVQVGPFTNHIPLSEARATPSTCWRLVHHFLEHMILSQGAQPSMWCHTEIDESGEKLLVLRVGHKQVSAPQESKLVLPS